MEALKLKIMSNIRGLDKDSFTKRLELRMPVVGIENDEREVSKDVKISDDARNRGNNYFFSKNHDLATHFRALRYYNESVAYAPSGSEQLATAFGNRSALLRHIRKYTESICEADKALKITTSALLQVKLQCRKADCYTALGSSENRTCLEKAKFLLAKSDESEITKKVMNELINKTQSVVDAEKLDIPKENKKKTYAIKMTSDVEKKDVWESIKMEYSKKDGRHLVANRDLEPGEIIMIEKPYFNYLNESVLYLYCFFCFEYLWTVVPCDHCAWRLYCSEKCKNDAWNEYHDLECSILVQMKGIYMIQGYSNAPLNLGMFLKALKEAGSINQLQTELKLLDKCKDECKKGFTSDGKFEGYKSIYTQPMLKAPENEFHTYSTSATLALIGLARFSNILGENYKGKDLRLLLKNQTAMFTGALMFKFGLILYSRRTSILLDDPIERLGGKRKIATPGDQTLSFSVRSLGFMNTLGCAPNVKNCLTYGNKYFLYTVHPIKKGSPLIMSIRSIHEDAPTVQRQAHHMKFYGCLCECRACLEDWTGTIQDENNYKECARAKPFIFSEILEEMEWIEEELKERKHKLNNIDAKLLAKSRNLVTKSWKHFTMPAYITARSISVLMAVYDTFFIPLDLDPELTSSCTN